MTQAETNSFYLSLSLSPYFCFFQVWGNHGRTDITSVCFIRSYQFSVAFYLYLCLGLFVFFRRLISSAGHNLSTSDAPKIGWNTHTHNQTLVHYFNWIMMIIRWQQDDDNNWPKFSSEITQQFITSETEILVHFRMENDFLEREPTHTHLCRRIARNKKSNKPFEKDTCTRNSDKTKRRRRQKAHTSLKTKWILPREGRKKRNE